MLCLFSMISHYPRSVYLLNGILLISISLGLLFASFQYATFDRSFIWLSIAVLSLTAGGAFLSLTSEWFDRKPSASFLIYFLILMAILGLGIYAYSIQAFFSLIMIAALVVINGLSFVNLGSFSTTRISSTISTIILAFVSLIYFIFFEPLLLKIPLTSPFSWIIISLPVLSMILAGIALFFPSTKTIFRVLTLFSALPFLCLAGFIVINETEWLNAFILLLISFFIFFSSRIQNSKAETTKFNQRWSGWFSIAFIAVLFLIAGLALAAVFLLDSVQSQNEHFALMLSYVFSISTLIFLLFMAFFIELIGEKINVHFTELSRQAEKKAKTASNANLYFSSAASDTVMQALNESLEKSRSLTKLRQALKTQTVTFAERQLRSGIASLSELSEKLENSLDLPVAAQYLVSSLQKSFKSDFCGVFTYNPDERRLIPQAIDSREDFTLPAGFRLRTTESAVSKAIRLKTGMIFEYDPALAPNSSPLLDERFHSFILKPLFREGYLEGLILLADKKASFFDSDQLGLVETAGSQLLSAWGQHYFVNSVANMIESSSALSNINELASILQKVVEIGRHIIKNQFTAVIFSVQEKVNFTCNGKAPELRNSIESHLSQLSNQVFRISESVIIRDTRRDQRTSYLKLGDQDLHTLLICPIRIHGLNIGAFLFFGKRKGLSFTEQDSFIAGLLAMQSAALIEGCLLDQELRNNLISTQLLHGLNLKITQAGDLGTAVDVITETAYRLSQAESAGLVLYTVEGQIESQSLLSDKRSNQVQPKQLIAKTMKNKEISFEYEAGIQRTICYPIITSRRVYGGLWLNLTEDQFKNDRLLSEISNLVQQASIALERMILLKETRDKADQVSLAYYQLQTTYDQTLMALVSAIDLRDRETEGHSLRVAQLALAIGNELGLSPTDLKALERGSLLHDVGKIGINDAILHKPGPLSGEEWKIMRSHPKIGAEIIESIPFLKDAVTVVANHQERWDGSGYPAGLKGTDIPVLARIFTVADVFDALISDRPYHAKISPMDALEYLKFQANILFDPQIIKVFSTLYERPNFLRQMGFYEI